MLMVMRASIIIPTYNEAELLPALLGDIREQRAITHEVIVADAQSTDNTREVARAGGARVVEGGMPAAGRNAGAAEAEGDFLVFLDADVRIPKTFLRNALSEMRARELAVATCPVRPLSKLTTDKIIHNFANLFIRMNQRTDPHAPGYCILMRRNVFQAIGGFDESLKVAEDHDLVKRAAEKGPFRVLSSTFVRVDVRRFEKEGRLWYALKTIKVALYRATVGEIGEDDSVVEYEFGDFTEDDVRGRRKMLRQLEKALIKLDRETTRLNERVLHGSEERPGAMERLQHTGDALRHAWEELFESSGGRRPEE
jgi:glycosyltransferase involved in cell wall biosynthesis